MSIRLPTIDLSTAVVGTTGTVSWAQQHISPALHVQMMSGPQTAVHVQIYNESGCGILISFAGDTNTTFIPAGGWRTFSVGPDIQQYTWIVDYVLANAPVTKMYAIWYAPGEPLDETGFLGNSPIGGTSVTTQVVQDGQTSGQQIVESTPTGVFQTILMTTDGKLILKSATATSIVYQAILPSTPLTNQNMIDCRVTGDTGTRIGSGIRSDGYGFIGIGKGVSGVADQIFDQADGLHTSSALTIANALASLGGQASVGSFGAPVIVAQAIQTLVTATTLQTILSFTPAAAGLYQVQGHISFGNNATQNPTLNCSYFDPNLGNPSFSFQGAGTAGLLLDGTHYVASSNVSIAVIPMTIYAGTGGAITIKYQDPGGTPNDRLNVAIFRIT